MLNSAPFSNRIKAMANIKSARKAARQSVKRRAHNASLRTQLSTAVKNVKKAITAGDKAKAAAALERSRGVIDRIAAKGVVHKNHASRQKSRLAQAIKAMA
jgi:small subunit ribosomal protein S20